MRQIGAWIGEILANPDDTAVQARVRGQVQAMCQRFRPRRTWVSASSIDGVCEDFPHNDLLLPS